MSVFHLKYRPKNFEDLDLKSVSDQLVRIFSQKDTPQSFLFAGPKGSGKTSAARIVASVLNCTNKDGLRACGKCDNCLELASGKSIDIAEIDAASNRGIDDIRQIKDRAYLAPSKLLAKVFIIDEVHMLTKEAFNALLKILEEPPEMTYFVLCTTDPEKIPETVLSRLLRVDFSKGNNEELKSALLKIIKGEKIVIDKESVDYLISKSDGSFRNITKLLNEMVLQLGNKIKLKAVREFFEIRVGDYEAIDFEQDLKTGQIKKILDKMERMADKGVDLVAFRKMMIAYFQKKLLALFSGQKSILGKNDLIKILSLLIEAGTIEKETEISQLPIEMAVVKFETPLPPQRDLPLKKGRLDKKTSLVKKTTVVKSDIKTADVEEKWNQLLVAVKPYNHSVEAFLRAARIKEINGDQVIFEVFYPFHKERLEEQKNKKIVEKGLETVFGQALNFACVLSKRRGRPVVIKNEKTEQKTPVSDDELYDVAKEIFG